MKKLLVINGPNLNMTGIRKKDVYGSETLKAINEELKIYAKARGAKAYFFQSNHEGDIIDAIQQSREEYDGVVINAGAYTHYSDIHAREDFRKQSVITDVCVRQICGYGKDSYKMGIDLLLEIL